MLRKKRQPAPFFNMPGAPFNPTTGENAQLGAIPSKGTTLALFQVVEDDTHDNYIVCRGHEADADPYFRFLHDPYTVPATKPINVAKPYAVRGTKPYKKGQIVVAARIKGKLGYNPGKGTTVGQPADLNEVISLLTDDANVGISWMEVGKPTVGHGICYVVGGTGNTPGAIMDLTWDAPNIDSGGLFSRSGTELTVIKTLGPSEMLFHIEWMVNIGASWASLDYASTESKILINGSVPDTSLVSAHQFKMTTAGSTITIHSHTSFWDTYLQTGDVLKLRAQCGFTGGSSQSANGQIRVTPVFGN